MTRYGAPLSCFCESQRCHVAAETAVEERRLAAGKGNVSAQHWMDGF